MNVNAQNSINPKQSIINNLKIFMIDMQNKGLGESYNSLDQIIEMHFKYDMKQNIVRNLVQHIMEMMQVNIMALLDYLRYNEYFTIENIGLEPKIFGKQMKSINRLKDRYGIFFRDLMQSSQNPFMLFSVETNVGNNDSIHNIKISRTDGVTLNAQFNSEVLMGIITSLLGSLKISMQNGIYNLSEATVDNFLKQSKNFNEFLNSIVAIKSNKSLLSEVALGKDNDGSK